jgi:hypothetical protein
LVLILHGISGDGPDHSPTSTGRHTCSGENTALNFLTGTIIWFDVLACVSTNSQPHLSNYYNRLLNDESLDLDAILGCQNWAIIAIGGITHLATKCQTASSDTARDEIERIERCIEKNLSILRADIDAIRGKHSREPPNEFHVDYSKYIIAVITQIFGCAAIIYLHNLESSPICPSWLEELIAAFRLLPDPRMIRGVLWPLCIGGSMATTREDQEFFRDLVNAAISDAKTFGNSSQALELLEKAWDMRSRGVEDVTCAKAIREFDRCVLLV